MPIAASELQVFNALNRPTDDTSTAGGARDSAVSPTFTQLAANDDVEAASTVGASDGGKTLVVNGRDATGVIVTANIVLSSTNNQFVSHAQIFERILSAILSSSSVGITTLRRSPGGANILVIASGARGAAALFQRAASEASASTRYDKIFWRNGNGQGLALQDAKVRLSNDPAARIRVGLATSIDDSVSVANRKTAPGGVTFVDDAVDQTVPTGALPATQSIGQWIELQLPANDPPHKTTFTSQISGTSI